MKRKLFMLVMTLAVCLSAFHVVSAHEVYVLNQSTISYDVSHAAPNPFREIDSNKDLFFLAVMIGVIVVAGIFLISISRRVEKALDPLLLKAKRWAPLIARLTLGLSLLAAGYYNALFGPELPLSAIAGQYAALLRIVLYVIGAMVLFGLFVRQSALVALAIFIIAIIAYKSYMLTYVNYLGEIIANLILGGGLWSIDHYRNRASLAETVSGWKQKLEPYAMPALRVLFGVSAVYASWYAKLFHAGLALDTVNDYHLTRYFHFAPLFIVLGALIIETLIGFFFILGIEIRFTALFFLFFLTLSLCFFGEVVWPHIILIGVNIAFIFHGYDKYSLEGRFFEKGNKEPVL